MREREVVREREVSLMAWRATAHTPGGAARRGLPGVLLALVAALAVLGQVPGPGLVATTALLLLTPWARTLAVRVMVSLVGVLALAAVALHATWLTWGDAALVGLLLGLLLVHLVVALGLRADVPLRPGLSVPDAIALGGGVTLAALLGLPYLGRSSDDVLLDLARGVDSVNHVAGVANLVSEQGSAWLAEGWRSPDGSLPVMGDYPLGVHAVLAAALRLAGHDVSRDVVAGYAWLMVLALAACASVLGWLAVRVATAVGRPSGRPQDVRARGVWAAAGYSLCAALSGAFVAPFELGHAPFFVAATAGVAASWLVLRHSPPAPAWAAAALLAGGGLALLGAYPPLVAGLAPAACVWALRLGGAQDRAWLGPAGIAGVVLVGLLGLWTWRGMIEHLVRSEGENSTAFAVSVVLVTLTAAGVWVAYDQGGGRAPARAMAAALGYLGAALALAVAAGMAGLPAGENYYGTKLAEAAWLAALPVACALVSAGLVAASNGAGSIARPTVRLGGVLGLALLLGVLPIGRADGLLGGPAVLAQRLLEADRARGQVRVTEAARLAGPASGDASAMVEPPGWFHRVAYEAAEASAWRREAVTASFWLASLRGVRTQEGDLASRCFTGRGDARALPCVEAWLAARPGRRITLVLGPGQAADEVRAWAAARSDVRLVTMP